MQYCNSGGKQCITHVIKHIRIECRNDGRECALFMPSLHLNPFCRKFLLFSINYNTVVMHSLLLLSLIYRVLVLRSTCGDKFSSIYTCTFGGYKFTAFLHFAHFLVLATIDPLRCIYVILCTHFFLLLSPLLSPSFLSYCGNQIYQSSEPLPQARGKARGSLHRSRLHFLLLLLLLVLFLLLSQNPRRKMMFRAPLCLPLLPLEAVGMV